MPKKKKLTPEERRELRKEKREKRRQKKEEKRRRLRNDELAREIRYAALTVQRHDMKWRNMLMKISLPKVREDLVFEWQTFERLLDVKDFTISLYMDEVQIAEEQYMRSIREHMEGIDKYVTIYKDILSDLQHSYDDSLRELREKANENAEQINANHNADDHFIRVMLFGLQQIRKDNEKNIKGDFITRQDEDVSRYSEIVFSKKTELENSFTSLVGICQAFIRNFFEKTHERRKEYNQQHEQDVAIKQANHLNMLKLKKMNDRLRRLRDKFDTLQTQQNDKICNLNMEKAYFKKNFEDLKWIMEAQNRKMTAMMIRLTTSFNQFVQMLKRFASKGEKVLQMIVICSKLQTQMEKVLPLPLPWPCLDRKEEKKFRHDYDPGDAPIMATFWNKIGTSNILLLEMMDEKQCLLIQNEKLKERIHRYCMCLQCPALPPIINSRTKKKVTIVDGNLAMRNYAKFNF